MHKWIGFQSEPTNQCLRVLLAAWLARSSSHQCRRPPRRCGAPTGLVRACRSAAAGPAEVRSPRQPSARRFTGQACAPWGSPLGCCHPPRRRRAPRARAEALEFLASVDRALLWEQSLLLAWIVAQSWAIGPSGRGEGRSDSMFLGQRRKGGWVCCYYMSFFDFWIYTLYI